MQTNLRILLPRLVLGLGLTWLGACSAIGEDRFTALDLRHVQVGGEIGRRIDVTIRNNLLVLDADRDFLAPFRAKTRSDGYIGLGKLIDATARFAAYTGDPKVLELKKHLVDTVLETQEPDGYIGMLAPPSRMRGLWDVHEIGYLIWGLLTDVAYQLRVADALLRLDGQARLGDLIERTIFNALFAAQSPDGRHLRYFSPIEGPRAYYPGDTYCCPCNYRRIVSELPLMVFYRADDGLVVSLYTPARARLQVARDVVLSVVQETDYPDSGRVQLRLDPSRPASFPVRLRIPLWARSARVTVNEQPQDVQPQPGTFLVLQREWKSGDRVTLEMPMAWRLVKGRQRQAGRVAIMRGPLIFSLNPSSYPELARQDAADFGAFLLDPSSLGDPVPSTIVRPNGLACRARFWPPGFGIGQPFEKQVEWTLTEFSDPDGRAAYFRLRDARAAVDDELFNRVSSLPRP